MVKKEQQLQYESTTNGIHMISNDVLGIVQLVHTTWCSLVLLDSHPEHSKCVQKHWHFSPLETRHHTTQQCECLGGMWYLQETWGVQKWNNPVHKWLLSHTHCPVTSCYKTHSQTHCSLHIMVTRDWPSMAAYYSAVEDCRIVLLPVI